jgi:hypothetical protein
MRSTRFQKTKGLNSNPDDAMLAQMEAVMCEADDLYFSMNEAAAVENRPLVSFYGQMLGEKMAVWHALNARLSGATVN